MSIGTHGQSSVRWIGLVALVLFLFLAWGIAYNSGLRIVGFHIVKVGGLTITFPPTESVGIFIDGEQRAPNHIASTTVSYKALTPHRHSIVLSVTNKWPWTKEVEIHSGETVHLFPFFVPQNPSGFMVSTEDVEYKTIRIAFAQSSLPTKTMPHISSDATTHVWIQRGMLVSEMTAPASSTAPTIAFTPLSPLRSIAFYKNRNDVVIASAGDSVFALELDTKGMQNFQPIYKGIAPDFRVKDDRTLYIKDGSQYLIVNY